MLDEVSRKDRWQRMKPRVLIALIGTGISIEILATLMHQHLSAVGMPLFGLSHATFIGGTALLGFLGTIFLVVSSLCLLLPLPLSRTVKTFGYATALFFVFYKALDLLYCLDWFSFQDIFGAVFGLDRLVMNLLLIGSVVMLLVTMMRALFELYKAERSLKERNDILDREVAEKRVLAAAIENAEESIEITDASGKIIYANAAFEHLMGYTKEEVLGQHWDIIENGLNAASSYKEMTDAIEKGSVWKGELLNKQKNGVPINLNATISTLRDQEGAVTHYVVAKRDVTREKMLERQAQQSQKLEAIGTLAGGVAHDLNNVLAVIIGHSEISMDRLEPDHPVRKSMEVIMRTANRSSKLIKQLLMFSRQGISEPSPMEPAPLVCEQLKVLRSYLPSNIIISDAVGKDTGCILAEPAELQQILFNLCTNANHAMQPEGGTLEIGMDNIVVEQEQPVTAGVLNPGEYVRLYIQDVGCGMDSTVMERLFEPFFTTKEVGVGTGLGLPMVHGSMMRSGGAITVTSTPGEGSRFDLYWPKLMPGYQKGEESPVIPEGNGRMVLVVDDTVDFMELVEMNLSAHGFNTVGFTDTTRALDYFCNNSGLVDIALVDYMMPGMNGRYLAKRLHEYKPDLPIVLLSGYSSTVTEENAKEYGFSAAISKPVETDHLIRTLFRCLPV